MNLGRLVRSELLKVRTTSTWWVFTTCSALATVLVQAVNMLQVHFVHKTTPRIPPNASPEQAERMRAALALKTDSVRIASDTFTAGQFIGGLLAMLLGILLVTSEYQHQTATTTFLTTPKRTPVILAKLVTALLVAAGLWAIATSIDLAGGAYFLASKEMPTHLLEWPVIQAILLNLMIYVLWAIFGVGWGALLRSQLGATISAAMGYVLATQVAQIVFVLVRQFWIKEDWVFTAMVAIPTKAAQIAVSPTKTYPESPAQWVGAAVMIAYGLGLGAIGTAIIRKRDVS